MRDERAVSEVLGYVFVFGIITATIAIVFTGGLTGLQDMQQFEQDRNMERAFDVLADNMNDIQQGDAPSRATEIRLAEGSLGSGDATEIKLNVTDDPDSPDPIRSAGPLVYSYGNTEVVYENGAVFRSEGDNHVMVSEPNWIVDDDHLVVPVMSSGFEGDGTVVSGGGTYLIVGEKTGATSFDYQNETAFNATVRIESPRAGAWDQYLDEQGFEKVDDGPNVIEYEIETKRLIVPITELDLGIRV